MRRPHLAPLAPLERLAPRAPLERLAPVDPVERACLYDNTPVHAAFCARSRTRWAVA
jgi:hypothetical protein